MSYICIPTSVYTKLTQLVQYNDYTYNYKYQDKLKQ